MLSSIRKSIAGRIDILPGECLLSNVLERCFPFLGQGCSECRMSPPCVSCPQSKWAVLVPAQPSSVPVQCHPAISAVGGQCCAFAVTILCAGRHPQHLHLSALQLCSKPSTFPSAAEAAALPLQNKAICSGGARAVSAQHSGRCHCALCPFPG